MFGKIAAWAQGLGWWEMPGRREFAGAKDGIWCVVACSGGNGKSLFALLPAADRPRAGEIAQALDARKKGLRCGSVTAQAGWVRLAFSAVLDFTGPGRLGAALDGLSARLRELGVGPSAVCAKCGKADGLEAFKLGNALPLPFCPACAEEIRREVGDRDRAYHQEDKHYLRGLSLAWLVTLPVIALGVLLVAWAHRIGGFLPVAIGVASMWGYKWSRARPGPATKWLLLAINVVDVVAANFLCFIAPALGKGIPFGRVWHALMTNPRLQVAYQAEWILWGFIAVIVWIPLLLLWSRMYRSPAFVVGRRPI